jgi:hypothetical protein
VRINIPSSQPLNVYDKPFQSFCIVASLVQKYSNLDGRSSARVCTSRNFLDSKQSPVSLARRLLLFLAYKLSPHSSHKIQKPELQRRLIRSAFRNGQGLAHSIKVSKGSTESTSISMATIDRVKSEFGNLFIRVEID